MYSPNKPSRLWEHRVGYFSYLIVSTTFHFLEIFSQLVFLGKLVLFFCAFYKLLNYKLGKTGGPFWAFARSRHWRLLSCLATVDRKEKLVGRLLIQRLTDHFVWSYHIMTCSTEHNGWVPARSLLFQDLQQDHPSYSGWVFFCKREAGSLPLHAIAYIFLEWLRVLSLLLVLLGDKRFLPPSLSLSLMRIEKRVEKRISGVHKIWT